jgi:23S rRNA (uracil1939-C5)-methyltransferase
MHRCPVARRTERGGPRRFKPAVDTAPGRIELAIERLSDEGRGIGHIQGKTVFVSGALPGESVTAEVTQRRRGVWEARAVQVRGDSPLRRVPVCPIVEQCGGCTLQHLASDEQLRHKAQVLHSALRAIDPAIECLPGISSPPLGYRHRARMQLQRSGGRWVLGYRQTASQRLCPVAQCAVLTPDLQTVLAQLPALLRDLPGQQAATVLLDEDSAGRVGLAVRYQQAPEEAVLQAWQLIAARADLRLWIDAQNATLHRSAQDLLWQPLPALEISYRPQDFTQANAAVNRALIECVLEQLQPGPDDRIIDAFAGLGNISLPLASRGARVTALEGDAGMVARARRAAEANAIDTLSAAQCDLFAEAPAILRDANVLVLDPPRAGAEALCRAVAESGIERIAYISCHPATLLRDLAVLRHGGFRLQAGVAADMFPQTAHLESLVVLGRV